MSRFVILASLFLFSHSIFAIEWEEVGTASPVDIVAHPADFVLHFSDGGSPRGIAQDNEVFAFYKGRIYIVGSNSVPTCGDDGDTIELVEEGKYRVYDGKDTADSSIQVIGANLKRYSKFRLEIYLRNGKKFSVMYLDLSQNGISRDGWTEFNIGDLRCRLALAPKVSASKKFYLGRELQFQVKENGEWVKK